MYIENYSKIKSVTYVLNDDNETFKITYVVMNENNEEIFFVYPRVKINWYFPKQVNYYNLPIPEGYKILTDQKEHCEKYFTIYEPYEPIE